MNSTFKIGSFVRNFGNIAKVVGYHDITGDLILQGYSDGLHGTRWIADSAKCELIGEADATYIHKDGLVAFG